jgi:hypothetical protein
MDRAVNGEIRPVVAHELQKHFRQSEALASIYLDLNLRTSLPATRGWAASPDFLIEIYRHALDAHPKIIIECGSGVSTVVLARCMQMNKEGHVYSLEHLPEFAEKTRREIKKHFLEDWATVLDAPLQPYHLKGRKYDWYSMEELPPVRVDMLVIDGPPESTGELSRYPAGPLLFGRLNASATVFLDDSNRQQERRVLLKWAEEFLEFNQEVRDCEKGCAVLRLQANHGPVTRRKLQSVDC